MPRKPRLFVSGATYHGYSRVARGYIVFDDPYEAEEFVEGSTSGHTWTATTVPFETESTDSTTRSRQLPSTMRQREEWHPR